MKKKKYAKLAASMLLLSMAVAPLAGCSGNVTHSGETGTSGVPDGIRLIENGVAVYTVVRGDNCSDEERDAAVKLKKRFQEITGVEIGITTDWEDKNEDNSDRYEILVGSTNRAASKRTAKPFSFKNTGVSPLSDLGNDSAILPSIALRICPETFVLYDSRVSPSTSKNDICPETS